MNACPICQESNSKSKIYCDKCHKSYCSLKCFRHFDIPLEHKYTMGELSDLEFTCCKTQYCAKCFARILIEHDHKDVDKHPWRCWECNKFFHTECDSDMDHDMKCCMCQVCVKLDDFHLKRMICKKCHDLHDVKQFYLVNLEDVKQYASYDLSVCKKFEYLKENCFNCNFEISDCLLINCDCESCKNIKCPTTLIRLMFGDRKWNEETQNWGSGLDITPIFTLNELASSPDNECNCEICKFWKEY